MLANSSKLKLSVVIGFNKQIIGYLYAAYNEQGAPV